MGERKTTAAKTATAAELAALDRIVERVSNAQRIYATFTQEQVDKIFRAAAIAAAQHRIPLAKLAVEETGMGIMEDKVIKNQFSSEYIYNQYKDTKTCGILSDDDAFGYRQVAEPIGKYRLWDSNPYYCGLKPHASTNWAMAAYSIFNVHYIL